MNWNLLADLPDPLPQEAFEALLGGRTLRVERIVSRGHASPEGFWYDQAEHEWVLVLAGGARLRFEGGESLDLRAGSCLNMPAHTRHRVEWTDPNQPTVWLAIFYT